MIPFNIMLEIIKIVSLTYIISYVILFIISWYNKLKGLTLPINNLKNKTS